jgi:hypothetical protein
MSDMSIEDETLLELINEEDFSDFLIFEKVAKKIFSSRDHETIRMFLKKMHFSFLANDESYRARVLERLADFVAVFSIDELFSICFDTLVGNYLAIFILMKQYPIINQESAKVILELVPRLEHLEDLYFFGFPYQEQAFLQIDERIRGLTKEEIGKLEISCNILFGIGILSRSREMVESFQQIYSVMDKQDYNLRAQLISSMLRGDYNEFSLIIKKFGVYETISEEQLTSKYFEIWKYLEKLSLPIFFDTRNLRYNAVLFNGNFYFLKFKNFEGKEKMVFPFSQVPLSDVSKVYDPRADVFYTPKERYGRLVLSDVYSFRNVEEIKENSHEAATAIMSMIEDEISTRIRQILKDVNITSHSPVELADVLTQKLCVNNPDDLRLSGFIIKGQSFGRIHLKEIAGQVLQVCLSPVQIVFLVHVPPIDDKALRLFIEECESKQKNYCVVDRNDLARLFMAYRVL